MLKTIKRHLIPKIRRFGRYLAGKPPKGSDWFRDIGDSLQDFDPRVIFDVGANVGQTTCVYKKYWPAAQIYSFEPVSSSFDRLCKATARFADVRCFRLAMSDCGGMARMTAKEFDSMNAILPAGEDFAAVSSEEVPTRTITSFCAEHSIKHIHLLKIDTEGHDLKVLNGADQMLNDLSIDLIHIEAGMNPNNHRHAPLEAIKGYLEAKNYFLFGVYDQTHEWPTSSPVLRYANLVFVSARQVERSMRPFAGE